MLAEFTAIKAHLDGLTPPLPVHLFYAQPAPNADMPPISQVPYAVLETVAGGRPDEESVGLDEALEFDLRVRSVASVADAPPKVAKRVRDRLAPGYGPFRAPMAGRVLHVEWVRTEVGTQPDRDVTFAQTNSHPFFGVDTYRAYSHPA